VADGDGFILPGAKLGKPLSTMALLMLLRRTERGVMTAHGFRSTFRDRAGDHCGKAPSEAVSLASRRV